MALIMASPPSVAANQMAVIYLVIRFYAPILALL
jgi:hypothetical protein